MKTKIEVENLGALEKQLKGISGRFTKAELVPVLKPGARTLQRAIKALAPKRTGLLKQSIRVKVGKGRSTNPYATVWTTFGKVKTKKLKGEAYYAYMVHNGTVVGRDGKRIRAKSAKAAGAQRIKPNPFVYNAFEANVQNVANTILSEIASKL